MTRPLLPVPGRTLVLALAGLAAAAHTQPPPADAADPPRGLFVSPMGEPFRGPDGLGRWFAGADADRDGRLSATECMADAARFFATLDANRDGEIDPDELTAYETVLVPEVHGGGPGMDGAGGGRPGGGRGHGGMRGGGMGGGPGGGMGRGGGPGGGGGGQHGGDDGGRPDGATAATRPAAPQGAARYGLLDLPEPVIAADANFDRGVDRAEFRAAALARCHLLDRDGDGFVARAELPVRGAPGRHGRPGRGGGPPTDD